MMKANFMYEGQIIPVQCSKNVKLEEIFKKFEIKVNIDENSVYYLYNGNKLDKEIKLEKLIGNNDISNEIKIIVNSIEDKKNNNLIKSKYIKCPKCKEDIRMKIKDYKINLYDCKNKHNIDNLYMQYM